MVLVLTDSEVAKAISMVDAIRLVEEGLRQHANGQAVVLPRLSLDLPGNGGAFRVMAASLPQMCSFGLKTLTGYPGRRIPGQTFFAILLFSAADGALRSIMAAKYLTGLRTGAATAVAATCLARKDASTLGLFGAGVQAKYQVGGLVAVRRLELVKVYDIDKPKAESFAREIREEFQVEARVMQSALEAVKDSDLVVTATTAREPAFSGEWLEDGTHASGMGSNSPVKRELDPTTFRRSRIVVDSKEQVLQEAGDLLQALRTGVIRESDIYAELGDIIVGKKEGRRSDREITLFKSVGVAVEDMATATFVYEQARAKGLGQEIFLEN